MLPLLVQCTEHCLVLMFQVLKVLYQQWLITADKSSTLHKGLSTKLRGKKEGTLYLASSC